MRSVAPKRSRRPTWSSATTAVRGAASAACRLATGRGALHYAAGQRHLCAGPGRARAPPQLNLPDAPRSTRAADRLDGAGAARPRALSRGATTRKGRRRSTSRCPRRGRRRVAECDVQHDRWVVRSSTSPPSFALAQHHASKAPCATSSRMPSAGNSFGMSYHPSRGFTRRTRCTRRASPPGLPKRAQFSFGASFNSRLAEQPLVGCSVHALAFSPNSPQPPPLRSPRRHAVDARAENAQRRCRRHGARRGRSGAAQPFAAARLRRLELDDIAMALDATSTAIIFATASRRAESLRRHVQLGFIDEHHRRSRVRPALAQVVHSRAACRS